MYMYVNIHEHTCIFEFQRLVALEKDNLPLGNSSYCICGITVGHVLFSQ